jgi:uncharacterized membrane protein
MSEAEKKAEIEAEKEEELDISSKLLSYYLIWSVMISLGVILFGTIEFLVTGSSGYVNLPITVLIKTGGPATTIFPHYVGPIVIGTLKLRSFAIIELGILLLILSPIGRIFLQILIYVKERDISYVAIATVVFLILIASLYLAKFVQ